MDPSATWLLQHHNTDYSPFVRWAGQSGMDMSLLASMVGQAEAGGGDDLMQVDTPSVGLSSNASVSCSMQQPAQTRSAARAASNAAMQAAASAAEAASSGAARTAGPVGQACDVMALGPGAAADAAGDGASIEDAEMGSRRPARDVADTPLRKLSISLIDTYKLINQVHRAKKAVWQSAAQGAVAAAHCLDWLAGCPADVAGSPGWSVFPNLSGGLGLGAPVAMQIARVRVVAAGLGSPRPPKVFFYHAPRPPLSGVL